MPKRPSFLYTLFASTLSLASSSMVLAQEGGTQDAEAWTPGDGIIRAAAAGISLPQTVASLSLTKSGEASHGGRAVDNYAQYLSEDGAVQATLYVYLPTYADASLAAYMTDKAVMARFGSQTQRTVYESATAAGRPRSAIRAVYDHAADGALTTAAGFVHAGRWIVKIRVTGPTDRRREVLAGLDGMLAKLSFDDPSAVHATAPASFGQCAVAEQGEASRNSIASVTAAPAITMPREGKDALCIRGTVKTADGSYDMLQQSGRADGSIILPIDDSGSLLAFAPASQGKGYQLSIHMVGQTDLYGVYDRIPSAQQIAAIVDGKDPHTAQAEATAAYAANGRVTMIRGKALKAATR